MSLLLIQVGFRVRKSLMCLLQCAAIIYNDFEVVFISVTNQSTYIYENKKWKNIMNEERFHMTKYYFRNNVLPGAAVVSFRVSGGMGQSGPQLPHLLWPPTWWPESSTNVEHHGLCSVRWAMSHMHVVWVTPLNRKGKIQGKFGLAPDTVVQTGLSLVDSAFFRATLDSEKKMWSKIRIHFRKKSMRRPVESHCQVQQARRNILKVSYFLK